MNPLYIYGYSKASIKTSKGLQKSQKDLRKASFEMILAYHALDQIRLELAALYKEVPHSQVSFICGTSHGSLYSTKDFLKGISKLKRARPFLFQNSLHNSITGFLAQIFNLKGPSFTVSTGALTGENCIELAQDLIFSGVSKACVVVSVDGLVEDFKSVLQTYIPGFPLTEGAGALILSNQKLNKLQVVSSLEIETTEDFINFETPSSYYDSNCIELIADALKNNLKELSRKRPNSNKSTSVKLNLC